MWDLLIPMELPWSRLGWIPTSTCWEKGEPKGAAPEPAVLGRGEQDRPPSWVLLHPRANAASTWRPWWHRAVPLTPIFLPGDLFWAQLNVIGLVLSPHFGLNGESWTGQHSPALGTLVSRG